MAPTYALPVACFLVLFCSGASAAGAWADKFGENINLTLFLPHRNVTVDVREAAKLVSDPGFDKNRVTVLYVHGYTESNNSESVGLVSRAFLKRGDHNFVLIDWGHYAASPYLRAFFNLYQVYRPIAKAIEEMVRAGMQKEKTWMVAHSMGGQLAGVVAKELSFRLPRITALDPAKPGFSLDGIPNLQRLDADLVDVIHTDSGYLGFSDGDGHLDFWPNEGTRLQPGCPAVVAVLYDGHCSHHRSWRYFAESLLNETAFPATPCSSWDDFKAEKCSTNKNSMVYMGIKAGEQKGKKGNFFLHTNSEAPFGRGEDGLKKETFSVLKSAGKVLKRINSIGGQALPIDFGWDS